MMSALLTILQWLFWIILGLAIIILISLYIRGAFRQPVKYEVQNAPSPRDRRFPIALASITNSLSSSGITTDFWHEPDKIQQARLDAISSAEKTIHFETFFMTPGKRANDFAAAIAERAAAGVKVKLVVDSYGTKKLPKRYWKRLEAAGVQVCFFNKFNWRAPANYAGRTHRKLLIIDSKFVLIGGAGISDFWDGVDKFGDTAPWLDVEMRLEGEIVGVLEGIFMQHWTYSGGVANLGRDVIKDYPADNPLILVTPGTNPTYRASPIKALIQNSIICARSRVWLASPYFLPDKNTRKLLISAKKLGADVRILTTSDRCDKKFVYYASYEEYGDLLRGGVEIYEYQPSMIHAKMLLIDDQWVRTGSANCDPRSFFHNDELDISTAEAKLLHNIEQVFAEAFSKSKQVSLSEWRNRSFWKHRIIGRLVSFFQWQL
ncbi:MAG: phospholipase D-like domain-containing protein [Oscillatoria sp. PMC 1050.18]|nr:phospholipase D-like domain-containing protein [Oscillatoria sp. PMC 1050.18]